MDKKKIICIAAGFIYAVYIISLFNGREEPMNITSILSGVNFSGYGMYYVYALFLIGIIVLYGISDTEGYIMGYGILHITRRRKRSMVVRNIIIKRIINTIIVMGIIMFTYIIALKIKGVSFDGRIKKEDIPAVCIFMLITLSLMLWQSLFEIIWDGRIALLLTVGLAFVHLWVGDMIKLYKMNENWFMVFYTNMGLTLRAEEIKLSVAYRIISLIVICALQMLLLNAVFKRKDIFSVKK